MATVLTLICRGLGPHLMIELLSQIKQKTNIAGRFPENSRSSFVDLQSQKKTVKKTDQKIIFSLKADMLYFE